MLQLLYPSLMTKLSTPPLKKFTKNLKKHITLLTYLLPSPAARVQVTSSRRWGMDIWHGLQHSAVDSVADGEHIFGLAYGPKEVWLHANWVSGHLNSETMFQIRRMCSSNWLTIHKVIIKLQHSCVIKNW